MSDSTSDFVFPADNSRRDHPGFSSGNRGPANRYQPSDRPRRHLGNDAPHGDARPGEGQFRGSPQADVESGDFDDLSAGWKDRIALAEPSGRVTLTEWRNRIAWHWEEPLVRVVAVTAVALIVLFVWYQMGTRSGGAGEVATVAGTNVTAPGSAKSTSPEPAATDSSSDPGQSPTTVAANPMVHVAGAVNQAGVVQVAPGARVTDAITAAGGPAPEADLTRINLAAPISDGQQVVVPLVGEPLPVVVSPGPVGGSAGGSTADGAGPVSINQATQADLEGLPGVGPAIASAILAERDKRGGFQSIEELLEVRGIGEQRLADLTPLISL